MQKFLCILLVLGLAACSQTTAAPTSTPVPNAPPAEAGVPVEAGGAQMLIKAVDEGQYYASHVVDTKEEAEKDAIGGQYQIANPGSRFIQVTLKVLGGVEAKAIYEWKVQLKDSQGNLYNASIRSSGIFAGGTDHINWIYVVPSEFQPAELVFPENISADLSSLLTE